MTGPTPRITPAVFIATTRRSPGGAKSTRGSHVAAVFELFQDQAADALKLRDGLASGGRVVVIDYRPKPWDERPWEPPPEQRFPPSELDAAMAAAGLVPLRVPDFLPEQFFVEYGRPEGS